MEDGYVEPPSVGWKYFSRGYRTIRKYWNIVIKIIMQGHLVIDDAYLIRKMLQGNLAGAFSVGWEESIWRIADMRIIISTSWSEELQVRNKSHE